MRWRVPFGRIRLWPLLKETAQEWNNDNCIRLGASLSYYTLLSLFPLILVVLAIVRFLLTNSQEAREAILAALAGITGGFRDEFDTALAAAAETRTASGIVGTLTLILGASWVFGELASAFDIIWDVEAPASGGPMHFIRQTFFSFALVLSVAFLLLVSMVINAVLAGINTYTELLPGGRVIRLLAQWTITLGVLSGVFAVLFKFLPRTHIAWRDVWLAAFLTACSWSILQLGISYYIALSSYKNYGAVGSILALVAWVYLSSQVLFLGGELSAAYARRYGSRAGVQAVTSEAVTPPLAAGSGAAAAPPPPRPLAARRTIDERMVAGGTGLAIGVLGTILAAIVAAFAGTVQIVRRLRHQ